MITGNVNIVNNPLATIIDCQFLTSVGGAVAVSEKTAAGTIDLGSLRTVTGNVTIANNGPCTNVTMGTLNSVTGNLTVQSCGTGAFTPGSAAPGGNTTLATTGYTTVSGTTARGSTTVGNRTAEATMIAQIPTGAFSTPVSFSLTRINPTALPPEGGLSATGAPASIDPVAAYQITFGVPVLNSPASLTFDVFVAGLDAATRTAFLAAVDAGLATLATKGGAAGSTYQAFPVCTGGAQPLVGGCVSVQKLDANGQPTTGVPDSVRFSNVVGHFSTRAVAIVTPCAASFSISPSSQNFSAAGGTGSVTVSAAPGCSWTAASNVPWTSITSGATGTGNGTVNYSVSANTGAARSGTLSIAGRTFTLDQQGAPADLAIAKVALPLVRTGHKLTYLMGVANLGPNPASDVVITDPLPSGTTFVRAFFQQVGCTWNGTSVSCTPPSSGTPGTVSGNTVSCAAGSLAPLAAGNLREIGVLLEVKVTAPAGTSITNRATVSSSNTDPRTGNNSSAATTRVLP